MTKPSLLPKPPFACSIWCDATHIYLEPPCLEGKAPHIAAYAKTEGGMSKALALVAQLANKDLAPTAPGYFRHGEARPKVTKDKPALRSDLQMAAKRALRKLGMI